MGKSSAMVLKGTFIWGLGALFYFYDYLLQVSPGAMKPELTLSFNLEAAEFGSISAYFHYAYGIMQIPAGMLVDRYGPRKLLTLACFLSALGSLVFGYADEASMAKFGRLLMGGGAAFALVSCLKIASTWFSPRRFAFYTGATVTIGFLGAAVGLSTVAFLVSLLSWRGSMLWGGYLGFALTALLWFVVRDQPNEHASQSHDDRVLDEKPLGFIEGLASVIRCRQTWIASIYAALMFVPTLAFALWGIPFLGEAHQYDRATSGKVASLIYVGWMFGAPLYGWISDSIGRRNLPMIVATIGNLITCLCIIYFQVVPVFVMGILFFLLGLFSSSFIVAFAVVRESNLPSISGTAIGFMNALNTFGGAIAQPIIGKVLDIYATSPATGGGDRVFSLADYQTALLSLPVCLIGAVVMIFCLKETYCKPKLHD